LARQSALKLDTRVFDLDPYLKPGAKLPPPYTSALGALFAGDCMTVLPQIRDSVVDTVFADPPFNLLGVAGLVLRPRIYFSGDKWIYSGRARDTDVESEKSISLLEILRAMLLSSSDSLSVAPKWTLEARLNIALNNYKPSSHQSSPLLE
jgi:hypothetical protein